MDTKKLESKIFDLEDKLNICEIALDINDDEELEPVWIDLIEARKEHIADLKEFLLHTQNNKLSSPRPLEAYNKAQQLNCGKYIDWYLKEELK